jgi:hypothetical protein
VHDGERVEFIGDGDRRERQSASQIRRDQDRPSAHAVDPHAGGETHDEEREELRRSEETHLER